MASTLSEMKFEQQVLNIIASCMPDEAKKLLIQYCCKQSLLQTAEENCRDVLNLAIEWIVGKSDDPLLNESGLILLKIWTENRTTTLVSFFDESVLSKLITSYSAGVADVFISVFSHLDKSEEIYPQLCRVISCKVTTLLRKDDINLCGSFSLFLSRYLECLPQENDELIRVNILLIQCLGKTKIPNTNKDKQIHFFDMVQNVCNLLSALWKRNSSQTFVAMSVKECFGMLSNPNDQSTVALSSITNFVPDDVINSMIHNVTNSTEVSNEDLLCGLTKIIQWLVWPKPTKVASWILKFFSCLVNSGKKEILKHLVNTQILQVFSRVFMPVVRESNFVVLANMLMNCLDSPEIFHKIVPFIPNLVDWLRKEKKEKSLYYLNTLGELVHTLMYWFPDKTGTTYLSLLPALKDLPKPSVQMMNKWLKSVDAGLASKQLDQLVFTNEKLNLVPQQKTGLVNLGNTCYMNSILQCLFMMQAFRSAVFSKKWLMGRHPVMYSLQDVFTFMLLSKRKAVAPENFIRHSRPPWFPSRTQQDCCEFVHYLMDKLEEEDKALLQLQDNSEATTQTTNVIEKYFKGSLCVTYKCLNCGNESAHKEDFTDILLAFPEVHDCNSGDTVEDKENRKSLKGGDQTENIHHNSRFSNELDEVSFDTSKENIPTRQSTSKPTANDTKSGKHDLANQPIFTIQEMLDYFVKPEALTGNNQYFCEHCDSNVDGERRVMINTLPQFLMLSLKRFSFDVKNQTKPKLLHVVEYPEELHFYTCDGEIKLLPREVRATEDVMMDHDAAQKYLSQHCYKLCSVVVHSGHNCEAGHYYSYALDNMTEEGSTSQWYCFNDENTYKSSYTDFMEKERSSVIDTTYIIIYTNDDYQRFETSAAPCEIIQRVEQDNLKFLQEIARHSLEQVPQSAEKRNYEDDDSPPPPGNCGSNGSNFAVPGNRFIF